MGALTPLWSSGGPSLGKEEKQAEDELREAESRPALLLRQEHHPQDVGEALRLPLRLRPAESAGLHGGGAAQHAGSPAGHRGLKREPNPPKSWCRPLRRSLFVLNGRMLSAFLAAVLQSAVSWEHFHSGSDHLTLCSLNQVIPVIM